VSVWKLARYWHASGSKDALLQGQSAWLPPQVTAVRGKQRAGRRLKRRGVRSDRRAAYVFCCPPSPRCGPPCSSRPSRLQPSSFPPPTPRQGSRAGLRLRSGGHPGGRARYFAGDIPCGGAPDPVGPRGRDRCDREAADSSGTRPRPDAAGPGRDRLLDRQRRPSSQASSSWEIDVPSQTVDHVDFAVDGTGMATAATAPFLFDLGAGGLDTTTLADGQHTLAVKATFTDGGLGQSRSGSSWSRTPQARS